MTNPSARVILPRDVTDAEIEAAHNAMFEEPYTCETDPMIGAGLDAARTAAPNAGKVGADMLEAAARAICELHIRRARQFDTAPARLEEMLTAAVNHAWATYIDDARAVLKALNLELREAGSMTNPIDLNLTAES